MENLLSVSLSWSFSFHALNEIRHLIWDLGYGFDLKISKITGIITIIGSLALTIFNLFVREKSYLACIILRKKWLLMKLSSIVTNSINVLVYNQSSFNL